MQSYVRATVWSMVWTGDGFVLQIKYGFRGEELPQNEDRDLEPDLSVLRRDFEDRLLAASTHPPVVLCRWLYIVDESLDVVQDIQAVQKWAKGNILTTFGDLYCSFNPFPTVLNINSQPPVTYRWTMSRTPTPRPPFLTSEVENAIRYLFTRTMLADMRGDAEAKIRATEKLVKQDVALPQTTSSVGSVMSLFSWFRRCSDYDTKDNHTDK